MYYDPGGYMGLCPAGKTNPSSKKGKDILESHYNELKEKHIENPDFFSDPDTMTILKGQAYIDARKQYTKMVKNGELETDII